MRRSEKRKREKKEDAGESRDSLRFSNDLWPAGQMRDEKLHAFEVKMYKARQLRSTFRS